MFFLGVSFCVPFCQGALYTSSYRGVVTGINSEVEELTVSVVEFFTDPLQTSPLFLIKKTGQDALEGLQEGDSVYAVSFGDSGDTWITIAKYKSDSELVLSDIYGI